MDDIKQECHLIIVACYSRRSRWMALSTVWAVVAQERENQLTNFKWLLVGVALLQEELLIKLPLHILKSPVELSFMRGNVIAH